MWKDKEVTERLKDKLSKIKFPCYLQPTYKNVRGFIRNNYGLQCNIEFQEGADYGRDCWMYQVIGGKEKNKNSWRFPMTTDPECEDENDEMEALISAIEDAINEIDNK